MNIHFTITPLFDSIALNILLIGICIYIFRRRQKDSLYNKLSAWYFFCFLTISLGAPIVTAMSSLKTWDELTSIQWFVLATSILVNACNTMLAFITQAAKRVQHGEGLVPTNGNTKILKKEDVPESTETQTTVEQQIAK